MLQLLFLTIFLQATVILLLVFKTPARKLVILIIDRTKRGHGPIVAKSVACTVSALLVSSLTSALKTWKTSMRDGDIDPTNQVLMAYHILQASLMGFLLFLALLTDRLHYYIRELHMRRKTSEVSRNHDSRFAGVEEIEAREVQVGTFKDIVRQLGSELDAKSDELAAADSRFDALKKESKGLISEFDRLLSDNKEFRARLLSLDQQLSSRE
ncbi:hypothetical protein V2J09_019315 [Rumex salicifolius]